ncbi:Serine/threonine protein phosphatase PrpC [Paenibacillus sp. UNCCL117]|uniref:Stp1/IreP family PP2C-type Ser/Thr phosphatase n=1 Tax=unclassified Paenibacillus TaxID=185978 RepID=UPI000886763D|nr:MULTISPECIES: Stp1/IreP family PP2C-type Ser/Thr phosphatase [unclassified Paenibacillus]SDD98360.1 Serine/threonine protein phosphatase PrpC [Paenibacillus sp. cl123]SFW55973.1 Serine/threonine protein phosphatase PrpC [Paenibacillus sp. UNCCL117]
MLKVAYLSDVGLVRAVNEDSAFVQEQGDGWSLAIVADGMGGHQAGDVASRMAIEWIPRGLQSLEAHLTGEQRGERLRAAIEAANGKIFEFASERENYHGMGTTVVAVLASRHHAVIGHIGDSRAYRIRGEQIELLTEDHSLVNELVKNGQITREEAEHHPRRNVLTRALGTESTIEVDVQEILWQPGDVLLLCSDGLSNLVERQLMLKAVRTDSPLEDKVRLLVEEALSAGGDDNVTVILIENAAEPGAVQSDGEAG